jgi:glycerol uptake facilitator-like aquaporin
MDRPLAERPDLGHCVVAEAVGTGLLVAVVVGSGIFAEELSPGQKGLQLLENSTATALGLLALILTFGPISGAHFNPVITLAERLLGRFDSRRAAAYAGAQVAGGSSCLPSPTNHTRRSV